MEAERVGNKRCVDLVIPSYRPDEKLEALIHKMENQTVTPRHIYIMNTEKSLFRCKAVGLYDNITVTHFAKSEFDHGGTRNKGAAMSDAPFILFMTQDAVPYDAYLVENLLKAFEDSQVAAAYAKQLADKNDNYLEYYTRQFNYPEESRKKTMADLKELGIKTFFCSNVCAMYRKEYYDEMNGFSLEAIFNEDMMLAAGFVEAGYGIYYAADAKVWHWHNYSGIQQFHRNFDVAVSQKQAGGLFTKVHSEKEGIRLVKSTCIHMLKNGKFYYIPKVIWQSGWKFLGYKLGQNYEKLPHKLVKKMSLNPSFWDTYWQKRSE